MKQELVNLKTAKLLKMAGFPQEDCYDCVFNSKKERFCLPPQTDALRWLRESRKLWVEITKDRKSIGFRPYVWEFGCYSTFDDKLVKYSVFYKTYEEAAEKGIQMACKYFIKLCK